MFRKFEQVVSDETQFNPNAVGSDPKISFGLGYFLENILQSKSFKSSLTSTLGH